MNLIFIATSIGTSAYLLATGMRRLRLPESTPRGRRWWARWLTQEGVIRPPASPSSDALDELVADLSRMGAVMRVCLGTGLGVGTILGVGIALATAGTVVSSDSDVLMVLMAPTLVGLVTGMTAAVSLHRLWHDPASNDRGVSLWQSFVRVLPGLVVAVIVSAITGARLLGRLATSAYRPDELYFPSIARDHPWTLWVLPVCLAAMFGCLLSLSLRLQSIPLFRSRDPDLALATGRQWREITAAAPGGDVQLVAGHVGRVADQLSPVERFLPVTSATISTTCAWGRRHVPVPIRARSRVRRLCAWMIVSVDLYAGFGRQARLDLNVGNADCGHRYREAGAKCDDTGGDYEPV